MENMFYVNLDFVHSVKLVVDRTTDKFKCIANGGQDGKESFINIYIFERRSLAMRMHKDKFK